MELTKAYILSQILIILTYVFLCSTYFLKSKKKILVFCTISYLLQFFSFILLKGYTGASMDVVAVIRNILFLKDEKKEKGNILLLLFIILLIIIVTIFTYNGILSLLSVIATIMFSYSVWQKNTKVYKIIGMPISMLWLSYYIYVKSLFGAILEGILLMCTIIGYILEKKKEK